LDRSKTSISERDFSTGLGSAESTTGLLWTLTVFVYGRRQQGPILIMFDWDKEPEAWREAGIPQGKVNLPRIQAAQKTIESVKCSDITIK
jgi:hypothetical protein